jgi:hypothetical protein
VRRILVALVMVGVCALALDAGAKVKIISGSPRVMSTAPAAVDTAVREKWIGTQAILRDAKSGKVRKPTEAETRELVRTLRELTARPGAGPRRVISPNGQTQSTADAGIPQVLIARATADGQNETLCVQTFEEAAAFLGLVPAGGDQ